MERKTVIHSIRRGFAALALLSLSISAFAAPIDINTADASTLAQGLNGVGEAKAQAIVADREQNGPFVSVDDLARVKGIGQKIIDQNRVNMAVPSD
jgi:competence protein ComEA